MFILNVLLRNVQKRDRIAQIVNIAPDKDVDILVLAENPVRNALSEILKDAETKRVVPSLLSQSLAK